VLKEIEKKHISSNLKPNKAFRIMTYQLDFNPFITPDEAIYFLNARLREISTYSPQLVVFPRYTANLFLGLLPLSRKKLHSEQGLKLSEKLYKILQEYYSKLVKTIGKITRVNLVAGTAFSPSEETIFMFSQDEIFTFKAKDNIRIINDGENNIAYLFPGETQNYKRIRELQEMGVNIFVTSENWKEKNEWLMRTGIWARSQTLGIFGINSAMVGNIFGNDFYGLSFISAPVILTKNYSGFVVKLNEYKDKGLVIADINLEIIESYTKSLPKTYKKYWSLTWRGES
ncbi:MAG: hypothetical protein J7L34_03620, partial [Thermotogaceae bacterium]|nr:hypothetical protein [Thermotogaceae bacterium]